MMDGWMDEMGLLFNVCALRTVRTRFIIERNATYPQYKFLTEFRMLV